MTLFNDAINALKLIRCFLLYALLRRASKASPPSPRKAIDEGSGTTTAAPSKRTSLRPTKLLGRVKVNID